ncbi:MAG: hypothetical protein ACJ73N_02200 [Bryobacteraceae bacterium]
MVAFIALVLFTTLAGPRFRVQVCMSFEGRDACKIVNAHSEEGAIRSAIQNACADISSGVTNTVKCEKSEPKTVLWLARPNR